MKRFTQLFRELDRTARTSEKVEALERYFAEAPPADAAWALQFLSGRSLRRAVSAKALRQWIAGEANLPEWLIEECYEAVGDAAETMALLLRNKGNGTSLTLSQVVEQRLLPLGRLPERARRDILVQTWRELDSDERMVWNKLITGNFRVGAAQTLVVRALARVAGTEPAIMSHRVLGKWQPTAADFQRLISPDADASNIARPYPFFLASPLEIRVKRGESPAELGDVAHWQMEWKWDGIRAQLIRRGGETVIWSRGDEIISDSFPEIAEAGNKLPDGTVLDGEILAWRGEAPLPFATLQRRLGRKIVSRRNREEHPIAFVAYDLLESKGQDWRARPLAERRQELEKIVLAAPLGTQSPAIEPGTPLLPGFADPRDSEQADAQPTLRLSPLLPARSWAEVAVLHNEARIRRVEGLMLKRADSAYGTGRQRGDWWKWKVDPFLIDAVLIAAQRGHGRRADLYTDYTFGLWAKNGLVPVAKAYSGLTDAEILQVDSFVRHNTTEKLGPVRMVRPVQVFEIAFEGIQKSSRHKSGVAVRFPRMNRWRKDKTGAEADTLDTLLALADE
jgi:DNA ligase-1